MELGLMIFPTDRAIQPVELAKEAEARGFESLWFPEHSHIPVSRKTPWAGIKDLGEMPEDYKRTHDQFVALAACAAVTENLKLGSGVCLVAQRDPVWLAKQVASLDMISGGRFLFGVGYGWNREEMYNHGVEFKQRREILRENILLMKEIWTQDQASFQGEHVQFEESWSWPKPVQKPHPPIILGAAAGPKIYPHLMEFCDGWMPIGGVHDFEGGLRDLERACKEAGRDMASVEVGVFYGTYDDGVDTDELKPMADMGLNRAVLPLPARPADEVLPILDEYAKLLG